jgi:hypothetical protein
MQPDWNLAYQTLLDFESNIVIVYIYSTMIFAKNLDDKHLDRALNKSRSNGENCDCPKS